MRFALHIVGLCNWDCRDHGENQNADVTSIVFISKLSCFVCLLPLFVVWPLWCRITVACICGRMCVCLCGMRISEHFATEADQSAANFKVDGIPIFLSRCWPCSLFTICFPWILFLFSKTKARAHNLLWQSTNQPVRMMKQTKEKKYGERAAENDLVD